MGRTICLWLISCLALGSAIPVPESYTESPSLIDIILNAKPEENDIDFHSEAPSIPETENLGAEVINPETKQLQDPSEQDLTPDDAVNTQDEPELPSVPIADDVQGNQETNDEDKIETPMDPVEEEQEYPLRDDGAPKPMEDHLSSVIDINDEIELQPNPEETLMVKLGNEEQMPTIVMTEEGQVNEDIGQLFSEEPIIPGFVEEPQLDEETILHGEEVYIVNSDMPPSGEEPVQEMLSIPAEFQDAVYFETYDSQEPVPEIVPEPLEDHLDVPGENPIEQSSLSTAIDADENPISVFEVPSNFDDFHAEGSDFMNEDSQYFVDTLKDFYIPEREATEIDYGTDVEVYSSEEPVQVNLPVQEETMAFLDRTPSDVHSLFGLERDIEESFSGENTETDDEIWPNDDPEGESYEVAADSSEIPDEDLPLQVYGDFLSKIDENIHLSPVGLEENNSDDPIIEIIRMDELTDLEEPIPFDVTELRDPELPENIYEAVVQGVVQDEQITPIEIPEEDAMPVVMEQPSYILPEDPSQQPIIFPDEILPKHNLPVFPQQWGPDSLSQPANDMHDNVDNPIPSSGFPYESSDQEIRSSYYSPPPFQGPSYSPPPVAQAHSHGSHFDSSSSYNPLPFEVSPFDSSAETDDYHQKFSVEELADMPAEMPPQLPNAKSPSEVIEFALFGNDDSNSNEPTTHFHLSSDNDENPMISNVDDVINDFGPFSMTSVPPMRFHQAFHGPNTFPLNLRTTDFTPDRLNGRYRERILPQNHNTASYFPDGYTLPQSFQEEISSPVSPNSMSSLPNVFFASLGETGGMLRNANEEGINMNFRMPDTPVAAESHQNFRPQQQEYDIQVSFIPYETNYGFQPYDGHDHLHFRYPIAQHTDSFSSYQRFPYRYPAYSESIPYQSSGYYPPQPLKNRYSPGFNYRDQYDHHIPYNYPTPRW